MASRNELAKLWCSLNQRELPKGWHMPDGLSDAEKEAYIRGAFAAISALVPHETAIKQWRRQVGREVTSDR